MALDQMGWERRVVLNIILRVRGLSRIRQEDGVTGYE